MLNDHMVRHISLQLSRGSRKRYNDHGGGDLNEECGARVRWLR